MFENIPLAELAIGRSTVRQRILALLMVEPGRRLHLREIQRRVGTSPGTASRELGRLVAAGLVEREAEGIQVYFRAADNPVAAMMRQLLLIQTDAPVLPPPSSIVRTRRAQATEGKRITPAPIVEPVEAVASPVPQAAARPTNDDEPALAVADLPAVPRVINAPRTPVRPQREAVAGPAIDPEVPEVVPTPHEVVIAPDPLGLLVGARFAAAARPLYGDRLKGIYLFGNRAMGAARDDADVELLVVLDQADAYGDELEKTSAICAQLTLELGLVVSRVFVGQAQWPGPVEGFLPVIEEGRS